MAALLTLAIHRQDAQILPSPVMTVMLAHPISAQAERV